MQQNHRCELDIHLGRAGRKELNHQLRLFPSKTSACQSDAGNSKLGSREIHSHVCARVHSQTSRKSVMTSETRLKIRVIVRNLGERFSTGIKRGM